MIELIEGIINSKKAPKEAVSFSYDKWQINYISDDEKYRFDFLMLKNQSLEKGTFRIEDATIYPDENSNKSLFFFAVNSLIKIGVCFLCDSDKKKDKVKEVQDRLILLRELPTNTEEEKDEKIHQIFATIKELNPAYLMADLNEPNNLDSNKLLEELGSISIDVVTIVKERAPIVSITEEEIDYSNDRVDHSINIGSSIFVSEESNEIEEAPIEFKSKKTDSFGKVFIQVFKDNAMAFLSFIAPALGVITFILLGPLYGQTNKALLIPFIITIVICFSLYIVMTYRCAIFKSKNELISYLLINTLTMIVAYGLSVLIYILFLNFDSEIKALNDKNLLGFVLSIVFAIILLTSCLYVRLIGKPIVKLFKKKNKK